MTDPLGQTGLNLAIMTHVGMWQAAEGTMGALQAQFNYAVLRT
jgi:hypothetical protein